MKIPFSALISVLLVIVVIGGLFLASTACFILDEREQAVITRFNRPVRVIVGDMPEEEFQSIKLEIMDTAQKILAEEGAVEAPKLQIDEGAGLYFKMPFVDTVERFADTMLEYDAEPENVVLADKKTLRVDNFARWRIENPLLFRAVVRTEVGARLVLDDIIYSILRIELGKNDLAEVIRTSNDYVNPEKETDEHGFRQSSTESASEIIHRGREQLMNTVTERANQIARSKYGIHVLDVRIKRADLVEENLKAVFARMEAERSRISKSYLSEGHKEAEIIQGNTDRQVKVLLANAGKEAEITRGEADAEVVRLYAEAFNANPELYRFLRSLEVIKSATPAGSELIIGLDSGIYQLLKEE